MRRPHRHLQLKSRRGSRGVGLFDALVALVLLAFGLLGMSRLQTTLVRQANDAQARMIAAQLGDELLSTALVDLGNAACYTVPASGTCASDQAKARAADWEDRVAAALPAGATATSALANNRLTVTISWTDRTAGDNRTLQVTTDVRE
jgi:type IV pilus assembly protein PilV